MNRRWWLPAIAVAAGLAVAATAANWDPQLPPSAPDTAAATVSTDLLQRAAHRRVFFGHMSIGWNILDGVLAIYAAHQLAPPAVAQVQLSQRVPELSSAGGVLHAEIGINGDPLAKLANFDSAIRGGIGERVDVAVLKFCFTDFAVDTDVEALFAAYVATMAALRRDFSAVHFVYTTVPLEVAPRGVRGLLKSWLGRDVNAVRERYNALVRQGFGGDLLLDVAAAEEGAPDRSTVVGLYPGYSSDGAHLNAAGSSVVAAQLLRVIAGAGS